MSLTNTTLVSAVTTQNVAGRFTNSSKTTLQTTTSCYAIEAVLVAPAGQVSAQTTYRVWFGHSPTSITAAAYAQQRISPMCLEVTPMNQNNGTTITITDAIAAMGTYLYCWVEMPSITAAGGTLTVTLIEHS